MRRVISQSLRTPVLLALTIAALLISIGRASAQPVLTVTPLELPPATPVTITVNGTPGHSWAVGGSMHPSGYVLNGVALALGADAVILGSGVLDPTGSATLQVPPPTQGLNALYYLQAVTAPDSTFAAASVSASVTVRPAGLFTNAPRFPQGLAAGGARITELGAPTAPTDAANKAYVDEAVENVTGGGTSGEAGGDLAGTYPNPTIAPSAGANIVNAINGSGATIGEANLPAGLARIGANNAFTGDNTFATAAFAGTTAFAGPASFAGATSFSGGTTFTGTNLFNSAPTFAAGLAAGNARIQSVGAPVDASDAATKGYVDSMSGGGAEVLRAGELTSLPTTQPMLRLTQTGEGMLMRIRTNSNQVPTGLGRQINMDVLQLASDGGWFVAGELGLGLIPKSGAGIRTMWHPYKAAFRTGGASGTQWDEVNVGFYSFAGGNDSVASSQGSFAFGDSVSATGPLAVAFGAQTTASGANSFAAGAGNIADGISSVALGRNVAACGDYSVALGHRASAASAPTVDEPCAGTVHSGAFVYADQSTTAYFGSVANNEFAMRAAGGFRFRTNATITTGCNLPAGSGVFSCSSDRTLKGDVAFLDGESVLRKVAALPVTSWRFLDEAAGVRHVGPMAQDFYAAFGLGDSDRMIGYTDINGINMRAIQALEARTRELQSATERIRALEDRLAEIEATLARLARAPR